MITVTLEITPQTHVRATKGDAVLFRIPEHKLRIDGLKRVRRLKRYNQYKKDLLYLAYAQKDALHPCESGEFEIRFYVPAPKYYRPVVAKSELKRKDLEGTPHKRRPDWDNLSKAFCDALWEDDSFIWNVSVSKRWTLKENGWIEIILQE